MVSNKLRVLDLFAGIGGFSLGLERTNGFETVTFCEIDKTCQKVLRKHWPHAYIKDDVKSLVANETKIDIITGGFPCQDISVAGKGEGLDGERSGLWFEYKRLIGEIGPRYAIIENVGNLRSKGLATVLKDLWSLGYDAEWNILPARAFGGIHLRERIFLVAHTNNFRLGRTFATEEEKQEWWTETTASQYSVLQQARTFKPRVCRNDDGISFELDIIGGLSEEANSAKEIAAAKIATWRILRTMWEQRESTETSQDLYRKRLLDFVPNLSHKNSYRGWLLGKRLKEDKSLCSMWEHFYSKSFEEAQDLLEALLKRIRTFERKYKMEQSKKDKPRRQRIKQLGNAIVPQIAEWIGYRILEHEKEINNV